ncbi:RING finger protein (Zin), putative [Talaromyces stipitatus ATCC 10500]|uniref:RING finger protein (Zin), putative n=1 Tax=Talaromyces stipitatus (strain ATCC 10500 / CBS 375.48 / QM 6759 / NRRL 1006) TaxID=441959 RepID=B8MDR1_TALSN|nr:RING finger protein (Zin), putative [Talaromyces stipitatus ATCC 10500]EED18290.1 RING finger protein (Zin), putative [Talaromyces stipitatus ATCC 10500]
MSPSEPRFTSPLRNTRGGSPNVRDATTATGSNTLNPTDITTRTTSPRPSTPISATINEALRNNPFGSTSRSRALEAEVQAITSLLEHDERRADLEDRNRSIVILAALFPDVRIEVFRELLMRFDGKSRLHVCVEQLLRHKKQWVQGRWNIPLDRKDDNSNNNNNAVGPGLSADNYVVVAPEELFRSETYKNTVKAVLCKEFSGLSRSTIDGVLAEVNFSYTRARPTLKELSRKGWRATISNLNPFRRKKDNTKDDNPLIIWERFRDGDGTGLAIPRLRQKTGSDELDNEIQEALIAPLLRERKETQEYQDYRLASEINEKDAMAENALYECQCCLDDVAFEQVSACSSDQGHMICFNCIRRTLHEAVFGQGWDNSVDPERSTLKCVAPVSHGVCEGHLDSMLVKRAILSEKAGSETYHKFEDRLASEALLISNLKLVRCPFCSYAEIDPIFHPSSISASGFPTGGISWRFRRGNLISTILTTILLLDLIPLLFLPFLITFLLYPRTAAAIFRVSLQNLCLRTRSPRFTCKNPSCRQVSCMTCHKNWRDPHTCEEPLQQSLRTTVEAARTAAVKRTCPRCNLSFVKSSGCNKLTCICGYSMCYICRKALNGPSSRRQQQQGAVRNPFVAGREDDNNNAADAEADEGDSGYKHFCEHFRVNPGTRCTECNKCELYFAEDEEVIARKAGEQAEREWRLRQSLMIDNANNTNNNDNNNNNPNNQNQNQRPGKQILNANLPLRWQDNQSQKLGNRHPDLYRIPTMYNHHHNRSWQYWLIEVWKEGRWKWELQGMADKLVEAKQTTLYKYYRRRLERTLNQSTVRLGLQYLIEIKVKVFIKPNSTSPPP